MAKPAAQGKATKSAMDWADEVMHDPAHQDEITALMAEIDLRQDLIALREARKLTQVQLAQRLGVTQSVIAKLEGRYTQDVKLSTLVKVAAALGARVKISLERPEATAKSAATRRRARPRVRRRTTPRAMAASIRCRRGELS